MAETVAAPNSPVVRAFHVLQVVVAHGQPMGVRELARTCGLPRSTTARLVGLLTDLTMIERTPDGAVMAGRALHTLCPGQGAGAPSLVVDRLRPLLLALVSEVGEDAAVAVDDGGAMHYVDHVPGPHPVSVPDVSGQRCPYHLVAPGLVVMAHWPPPRLDRYLAEPLAAGTPSSITNPHAIRPRLAAIRQLGYAWAIEELDVGVNGLAVPVYGSDGQLVATVSVYGPAYRLAPNLAPDLGSSLRSRVEGMEPASQG